MRWEIDIRKSMGAGAPLFVLDLTFTGDRMRLVLFGPSGAGKTLTLKAIWDTTGLIGGTLAIGVVVFALAFLGLAALAETYGKNLDYAE